MAWSSHSLTESFLGLLMELCKALARDWAVGHVGESQKMSGSHVGCEIAGEDALWGNGVSGKGSFGSCKEGNYSILTMFWEPGFQTCFI